MLYFDDGAGGFVGSGSVSTCSELQTEVLADFEGDGDADLAVGCGGGAYGIRVYVNDGAGRFTSRGSIEFDKKPVALAAADLDGDGDTDLAASLSDVLRGEEYMLAILLNDGAAGFALAEDHVVSSHPAWGVAAGDVDGDGDADLAVSVLAASSVHIYTNAGAGRFSFSREYSASSAQEVFLTDLNGDGAPDLVSASPNSGAYVRLNDGAGSFGPVSFVGIDDLKSLAVGDVDRDGVVDLAAGCEDVFSNQAVLLFGVGDGTFRHDELTAPIRGVSSSIAIGTLRGAASVSKLRDSLSIVTLACR